MPKPKKSEEMSRPPAPKTTDEMRQMMGEIWALLFEERRVRLESERRHAKAIREADERQAEYAKRTEADMAELRRTVEGIGKRTGDFMENTGRILEQDVLDKMRRNGGVGPVKGKVMGPVKKDGEYDGVVVNGEATLVLEIKRKLLLSDVREFLRHRLPRFAREFPDLAEGRKIYGAMAFELEGDKGEAAELARKNGLLLVQVGARKRMKVLNPDPAELRPIAG